jgi:hypothetical protein
MKRISLPDRESPATLDDIKVPVRLKLFAMWSSAMFCYLYGDYFELYQPGKLEAMLAGRTAFGAISQEVLLGMAAVMVIPSLMAFLSLVLPSGVNRWVNIFFGSTYTIIMILAIQGSWHFYILFGLIEIALTTLIVWYAWTWPKQAKKA